MIGGPPDDPRRGAYPNARQIHSRHKQKNYTFESRLKFYLPVNGFVWHAGPASEEAPLGSESVQILDLE